MNKSKMVFVAILLFALIPLAANATITRVIGLGGADANFIVKDAFNPSVWPQLIREYPNLAGGEFAGNDFMKAYITYDFGADKSCLQVSLDKYTVPMFRMGPAYLNGTDGGYNKLSFIYGRPMGDLLVGIAVNYTGKSAKEGDPDGTGPAVSSDMSYSTFGANLGVTALEKKLDLALGFDFASFSDKEDSKEILKNDGSMDLRFAGRYWYQANDKYALIPNVRFMTKKDGAKVGYPTSVKMAETVTMFSLGVGNNWTPVEDMLALFEVGLQNTSDKFEAPIGTENKNGTNTEMNIYWRLGFETKIFEWLDGRIGAERYWVSEKYEWDPTMSPNYPNGAPDPGKPEYGQSETYTYVGASAHWNRLHLDLLVDPGWLQRGPYFVGGTPGNNMFSMVSLKYDFNK